MAHLQQVGKAAAANILFVLGLRTVATGAGFPGLIRDGVSVDRMANPSFGIICSITNSSL